MFRSGIHRALSGGTVLGMNSSRRLSPASATRDKHNESWDQTSPPPQTGPTPQRRPVNMSTARWTAIMDPRNFQDVRGGGPLYTMTKIELDPNPEKAKTQWRHLCVEHEQKLRMANKLWRANKELEVRCHCVEADTMQVRLALADASLARKRLMADNKWLEVLRNGAEAKLERTREVLDEVSQERRELVAKVQKARDTIEGLRQTLATREKELAEISVLKYRYEKYEARRGKPPEIMVLWGVALTLGVELTVAGCYVLIPMMV